MTEEDKKTEDNKITDLSAHVRFLGNMLDKTMNQTNNLDGQTNIILGITSAIFLFSATKINSEQSAVFLILMISSALSILGCMISIHPPKFLRVKNKHESIKSLFSNKRVNSYSSSQEYADQIMLVAGDARKMTEHYAASIYNTNVNYYRPKRNLFKLSLKVLIAGILLASLLMIYQR